ncbi:hypothetical protein Hanom_Chr09g00833621 [Helianthus anomalus]
MNKEQGRYEQKGNAYTTLKKLPVVRLVLNGRTLDRRWLLTIVLDSPSMKLFLSTQIAELNPNKI